MAAKSQGAVVSHTAMGEPAPKQSALSTGKEVALDLALILTISAAICLFADQLVLMTVLVPVLLVARMVFWVFFTGSQARRLSRELIFFGICILLGAFNDWNSVVRHQIYEYTVPHFFPGFSTIPIWMLLYWGAILRFLATAASWPGLGAPFEVDNHTRLGRHTSSSPKLKIVVLLLLVLATRQSIYQFFADPILSWLPFAVALLAYVLMFGLDAYRLRLVMFMAVLGPAIEILYIQVGHLHQYQLGWIVGVPLWIQLWWLLGILVWSDLSRRMIRLFTVR